MASESYNHHLKAGNQGDVVKHPVLMAALDAVLTKEAKSTAKPFHYFDICAGHAWHPLLDEAKIAGVQQRFEWTDGIGLLDEKLWRKNHNELNLHVKLWRDWYIPQRESLVNGWYPGSSIIAADMCRKHRRAIHLTLFDISPEARSDLERFFCPKAPTAMTRDNFCDIHRSFNPRRLTAKAIREPNFVFIDPPGWRRKVHPKYPDWQEMLAHVLAPRGNKDINGARPTLMWMSGGGQKAYPWNQKGKGPQRMKCDSLREHGYSWTAVRWNLNSFKGCILAYNCAEQKSKPPSIP